MCFQASVAPQGTGAVSPTAASNGTVVVSATPSPFAGAGEATRGSAVTAFVVVSELSRWTSFYLTKDSISRDCWHSSIESAAVAGDFVLAVVVYRSRVGG